MYYNLNVVTLIKFRRFLKFFEFPALFRIFASANNFWKGARVVESAGLENRNSLFGYRGFESLPFRQTTLKLRGQVIPDHDEAS
jgi:hypothetical protein